MWNKFFKKIEAGIKASVTWLGAVFSGKDFNEADRLANRKYNSIAGTRLEQAEPLLENAIDDPLGTAEAITQTATNWVKGKANKVNKAIDKEFEKRAKAEEKKARQEAEKEARAEKQAAS